MTLTYFFGTSGPVSSQLLVNMETLAMGMTIAVLVFPVQCFLCFLFRKAQSQVSGNDMKLPSFIHSFISYCLVLGGGGVKAGYVLNKLPEATLLS